MNKRVGELDVKLTAFTMQYVRMAQEAEAEQVRAHCEALGKPVVVTAEHHARVYWVACVGDHYNILVGPDNEEQARRLVEDNWPGALLLGKVREFVQSPSPYFFYSKADFYADWKST